MNALTLLATPAFAGGVRAGARARLDQLEQAVAAALAGLKPGRRGSAAVHEEMQRLVLTNAVLTELSPQVSPAAAAAVVEHLRPSSVIDDALKKTSQAHAQALGQAGIPAPALELLESWVEVMVDARVVQRQIELKRAIDSVQGEMALQEPVSPPVADPSQPLSAAELGQALGGLSDETVRQRERAGELFSILRPGRKRGREYPTFQAWTGISGQPLTQVLGALGTASSTAAYGFFTSTTDLLGGLTPIEALLGRPTTPRRLNAQTLDLLAAAPAQRLEAVVKAAEAQAAQLAA
jgi:hypothetical protein